MKGLGIALIVIGIVMMIFRSINFTTEKKVADIGPLEINKQENKNNKLATICGCCCNDSRCSCSSSGK